MSDMKLEPCPFCGNSNLTRRYEEQFVWVECGDCEMQGPVASHVSYAEGYWNRRFSPSAPPPPEVVGVPREATEVASDLDVIRLRMIDRGEYVTNEWADVADATVLGEAIALLRALSTGKASAP